MSEGSGNRNLISHEVIEQATREVLETTGGVTIGEFSRSTDPNGVPADVVGTLTLSGTCGGTVVMYCGKAEATKLASGMMDLAEGNADDEIVLDAVGELLNQIAGTIKRKLAASGGQLALSVPVVVLGTSLSRMVKASGAPLTVHVSLDEGNFGVSFWLADQCP